MFALCCLVTPVSAGEGQCRCAIGFGVSLLFRGLGLRNCLAGVGDAFALMRLFASLLEEVLCEVLLLR